MAAIVVLVLASCKILAHRLKQLPGSPKAIEDNESVCLPPAELAFLARSGDFLHAVLVMAVDLTQRAVKSTLSGVGAPPVLDYEAMMWEITKS